MLLTIDAEKLQGWKGAPSFFMVWLCMETIPAKNVGDVQGVSNIGGRNDWKLFEGRYQQNLFHQRLSILAGLYDVTSEFPDAQYLINPGSNPSIRNAFVAGFRLEIHMNWFQ